MGLLGYKTSSKVLEVADVVRIKFYKDQEAAVEALPWRNYTLGVRAKCVVRCVKYVTLRS